MRKADTGRKRPAGGVRWDEQNLEENEVIKATISKTKITEPKTPYHGPLSEEHMADMDMGLQPLELDSHPHNTLNTGVASGGTGCTTTPPQAEDAVACSGISAMQLDSGQGAGVATQGSANSTPVDCGASGATAEAVAASVGAAGGSRPGALCHSNGPGSHHHNHHNLHAHFESPLQPEDGTSSGGPVGRTVAIPDHDPRSGFSSDSDRRVSLTGGSDGESSDEARRMFEQRRKAHYNMRAALYKARQLLSEDGGDEEEGEEAEGVTQDGGDVEAEEEKVADEGAVNAGEDADKAELEARNAQGEAGGVAQVQIGGEAAAGDRPREGDEEEQVQVMDANAAPGVSNKADCAMEDAVAEEGPASGQRGSG